MDRSVFNVGCIAAVPFFVLFAVLRCVSCLGWRLVRADVFVAERFPRSTRPRFYGSYRLRVRLGAFVRLVNRLPEIGGKFLFQPGSIDFRQTVLDRLQSHRSIVRAIPPWKKMS